MRLIPCLLLAAFVSAAASGQIPTYDFLRSDVGPRAAALSGSFVSMSGDPTGLFYNPASLTALDRPRASIGYFRSIAQTSAGHAVYAQEFRSLFLAAGVIYMDYGTMIEKDASANTLGEFTPHDFAFMAGAGMTIEENLSAGAAVKFISSSLGSYTSSGIAFDLGVLYQIPERRLTLGASLQNFGRQIKSYAGTMESLPLDLRVGITTQPEHLPVLLNLNFHKLNEDAPNLLEHFNAFSFGAEFVMSESVRLRVGYNNEQRRELKLGTSAGLLGFSFGGGILIKDYQFDVAYNSLGKIGGLLRLGLGIAL